MTTLPFPMPISPLVSPPVSPWVSAASPAAPLRAALALALLIGCGGGKEDDTAGGDGADGGAADGGGGDGGGDGGGGDGGDGADGSDGTDGTDGAPDPSPTLTEATYRCSPGSSSDDAIIFQAVAADPQGADTLDRLAGTISCVNSGGTDVTGSPVLTMVCGPDGACAASFVVNSPYPIDCSTAPDHTCTGTVYDEDGNAGSAVFTWAG